MYHLSHLILITTHHVGIVIIPYLTDEETKVG